MAQVSTGWTAVALEMADVVAAERAVAEIVPVHIGHAALQPTVAAPAAVETLVLVQLVGHFVLGLAAVVSDWPAVEILEHPFDVVA